MITLTHRIQVVREHLDRIERADAKGLFDESAYQLMSGLMSSFQSRLENVRDFVPDVPKDAA